MQIKISKACSAFKDDWKGSGQMVYEYQLRTETEGFYDITLQVNDAVKKSGVVSGICVVYTPHTTSAITVNENADPDVKHDLLKGLSECYPELSAYRHMEGNSTAHLKSSCVGCSETLIVENGRLLLGMWQDVYFCEFDGPRSRHFYVKVVGDR